MTVLKQAKLWFGGWNLTTAHNTVNLTTGTDAVEDTTFGSDSRTYKPGLNTVSLDHSGFFDADGTDLVDDRLWAQLIDSTATVVTVAAVGAAGDVAFSFESVEASYTPIEGSTGDMVGLSGTGQGTGDAVKGTVMEAGTTARSTSSNSTAYQLGDITATETGYAALHVIATSGSPTLDVKIVSDDAEGIPSSADQITFTQATGQTAEFLATSGVITDDWWRAEWTFGGTGSITFVVNFGIN